MIVPSTYRPRVLGSVSLYWDIGLLVLSGTRQAFKQQADRYARAGLRIGAK